MKKYINLRWFIVPVILIGILALSIHALFGVNFWIVFAMVLAAFFINGLIAEREDNKPGGFNNPIHPKPNDPSDPRE